LSAGVATRTIGVAIAIPEPHGGQLQTYRLSYGDPLARSIPTHVTVLPPTDVHDNDLPAIEDHLRKVAQAEQPFDLHLRGTGTFRPVSPVVFVQLALGIGDCERIEAQVRSGPLSRELGFYYHPHVTVAHDLPDETLEKAYSELAGYEARFPVWGFSLYEHGPDGVWRPQRDYPFGLPLPGPAPATGPATRS
jgi:2'-5' RNA ligase